MGGKVSATFRPLSVKIWHNIRIVSPVLDLRIKKEEIRERKE
jgi:hypothetical protein